MTTKSNKYVQYTDDAWKELVSDKPIIYSKSELLKLRANAKKSWRKYLHILFNSKQFKKEWDKSDYYVEVFEPHHKKEVLDIVTYQFSSCGNNNFHKILNTPNSALRPGFVDDLDHICLTGLGYVLLDKYGHVCGVFYGWDSRDEPPWKSSTKYHINSLKEEEILIAANKKHSFANNIFIKNKNKIKFGSVFVGEVLCVRPDLMRNGWFTKLSFGISILYAMNYDVYYDFDFQPARHLYNIGAFKNIPLVKHCIIRYDLFYFGDFVFECDNSKLEDEYKILKDKYKFKDVEELKKNANVGCFIVYYTPQRKIAKKMKADFNFIDANNMILTLLNQQYAIQKRNEKKKRKLKSKL